MTTMPKQHILRTVLSLLRAGLAKQVGRKDVNRARGSDGIAQVELTEEQWRSVIALASAHLVLPALHSGMPGKLGNAEINDDAPAFLAQIAQNNAHRNAALYGTLVAVAQALNEIGVEPMVLKGAAFLAGDGGSGNTAASWRFMSDLDLLVPQARLDDCVTALSAAGFTPTQTGFDAADDAHYPPVISPCGQFAIELHHRLFRHDTTTLSPDMLLADALSVMLGTASALAPSREHRIAHLIAHAQLQNGFYESRRIMLRDFMDLSVLLAGNSQRVNWSAVLQCFASPQDRHAARSFIAAWQRTIAHEQLREIPGLTITRADNAWADRAIARLGWSQWRRGVAAVGRAGVRDVNRLARSGDDRHRLIRQLRKPRRLGNSLAKRATKLRQSLWA